MRCSGSSSPELESAGRSAAQTASRVSDVVAARRPDRVVEVGDEGRRDPWWSTGWWSWCRFLACFRRWRRAGGRGWWRLASWSARASPAGEPPGDVAVGADQDGVVVAEAVAVLEVAAEVSRTSWPTTSTCTGTSGTARRGVAPRLATGTAEQGQSTLEQVDGRAPLAGVPDPRRAERGPRARRRRRRRSRQCSSRVRSPSVAGWMPADS